MSQQAKNLTSVEPLGSFQTALRNQLVDASRELTADAPRPAARTQRRRRFTGPLAVVAALVIGGSALAASGVWHPTLGDDHRGRPTAAPQDGIARGLPGQSSATSSADRRPAPSINVLAHSSAAIPPPLGGHPPTAIGPAATPRNVARAHFPVPVGAAGAQISHSEINLGPSDSGAHASYTVRYFAILRFRGATMEVSLLEPSPALQQDGVYIGVPRDLPGGLRSYEIAFTHGATYTSFVADDQIVTIGGATPNQQAALASALRFS